jgi:DNA-binding response OmpR family regulator
MSVDWVQDGKAGLEAVEVGGHDLVLLDLGLPQMDGIAILSQARKAGVSTPFLVLTARDDLETRVTGLNLGADDYVLKPFQMAELLARMRAVVRRHAGHFSSLQIAGDITLNLAEHWMRFRAVEEPLSAKEFALMRVFCERPGMIFSREQIEGRIYGWGEEVESNAVDVLIFYVRKKFGKDVIRNIRGAGWLVTKGQ